MESYDGQAVSSKSGAIQPFETRRSLLSFCLSGVDFLFVNKKESVE